MLRVYKEGIERFIKENQLSEFKKNGYVQVNKVEPQPKVEVEIKDEYTIKPVKKKGKRGA